METETERPSDCVQCGAQISSERQIHNVGTDVCGKCAGVQAMYRALVALRFFTIIFATALMVQVSIGQGFFPAAVYLFSGCFVAVWSLHWGNAP